MLFLFIARTLISAIFKTILCETIMTDMACLYLPIHRADIGVYAKNRKNVDQQWKRNWNICSLRVMAKTKLSSKFRPFPFLVLPSLYFCKGNRKTQRVNFIPNFWFFCPLPPKWWFLCDFIVPSWCFLHDGTVPSYNHYLIFYSGFKSFETMGLISYNQTLHIS